jgi:hypothetical protein
MLLSGRRLFFALYGEAAASATMPGQNTGSAAERVESGFARVGGRALGFVPLDELVVFHSPRNQTRKLR